MWFNRPHRLTTDSRHTNKYGSSTSAFKKFGHRNQRTNQRIMKRASMLQRNSQHACVAFDLGVCCYWATNNLLSFRMRPNKRNHSGSTLK
ncbi:hypothetical protein COCSUDRAFT_52543 [Coccomyxa subellipsoidea C-169]|uniref:Uncharacterized protein n=1 Tax=Coccomyxa subellipsoidea (strain C-169) TaxID=574566 RepID=I0Z4X9_COCSC|nr:hypothetical protein COCSUDRAFT_52543 [Coccomyxa subellipsoidea C-169]EIE25698.1 hypothetical protein COCSUDRAFT_52543 [Coccomyxa subellipsoidea C-169]|eukprot:XP_005650242.1 hypothetical protein COCSUDRAFT_52543 [Coccomyxa subellipsoidea C-169]